MSLANIKGKLSRAEMRNIMAGSEGGNCHRIIDCEKSASNGEFFNNCPSLSDLGAGCKCTNYTCPG